MERENEEKKDKFLLLFVPTVNQQSDVFVCCSIINGNQFISIIMMLISGIYFYNALYTTKLYAIIDLIFCLVYGASGCFLFISTRNQNQNYIYTKIAYVLYEITFFVKFIGYIILFLLDFIYIFGDLKYLTKIFAILLGGLIELGVMAYFIYVMYCFLIISKFYNNDINKVGAEYQELLKDIQDDKEFKELKN